ncbi:MAG: hypothetical protein ACOX56_01405 [Acholeplasmataceae bacterium]|jgi:exonuclease SbcC
MGKRNKIRVNDKLTKFYEQYLEENRELFETDEFSKRMYRAIQSGDKELYYKNVAETKVFDENWIETLESYFPSLDNIVRNPKSTIKYEEELVPVEKVRKTSSLTIRHLSANTHLIKEIEDDLIKPKKLLTTYADIDYATYENRMVASLIHRLFYFVRARYEVIKEHGDSFQQSSMEFKTTFELNKGELNFDLKVGIKEELDNKDVIRNNKKLLKRVERLEKLVTGFMGSQFMKDLKNAPRVRTPIMKTIVLQKNIHYKNCYMLWLFLDRYNTLAFETEIRETHLDLTNEELHNLYNDIIINLTGILYHQENRKLEFNKFDRLQRKKSVRIMKDLEVDPGLAEDFEIEDTNINQYYLEQSRKLFQQSLEYHEANSSTYEVALKRALRETIEFSNRLYYDFFEFAQEEDIFRRLITKVDPKDELEQIRKMADIAKVIREVKEVDYRKSVSFERKLLLRIAELDKILIKSGEHRLESLIAMEKAEMKLQNEQQLAEFEANNLKAELEATKAIQKELDDMRRSMNLRIKEIEVEYRRKEREAIKDVRQEFKEIQTGQVNQEKERHQEVIETQLAKKEETIIKMQEDFIARQDKVITEYQKVLAEEGIEIDGNFQIGLADLRREQAEQHREIQEEIRREVYDVSLELGRIQQQFEKDLEEYIDLKRTIKLQSNNPVARKIRRQQQRNESLAK